MPIDSGDPTDAVEGALYIAGAIVKPGQEDRAAEESVTLLNASDRPIDLAGWSIANKAKRKFLLGQTILPGQYLTIPIAQGTAGAEFFRNKGDIITLLNADGLKVHGVSYTQRQVRSGWTIKF
ncbi:lamin tail domain-containing protein [Paenibacillus prosopidis]|uniref:lamin tail domain-containing protein n=1 Tax=Paenibacillus prosopidis TaxID=630520 RepID=UPI003CCC6CF0